MLVAIAGIILSYLLGSVPTAYIFGKIIKGTDIRLVGSGNVGATNAFRLLGTPWAICVLLIDIAKGLVSITLLASWVLNYWDFSALGVRVLFGLACIIGHNWTVFLQFKGGKGVATTLGVLIGLAVIAPEIRLALTLVIVVWVASFLIFRIVSVASILSALSFPIFIAILSSSRELLLVSTIFSCFIIIRHKKNLLNLLQGKELPLSFKKHK